MKKTLFFALAFAAILTSCSSNNDLASAAGSSETTTTVATYVASNYPDTKVVSSTVTGSTVETVLNTGEELSFSADGTLIAYTNNSADGLAADSLVVPTDSIGKHGRGGKPGKGHGKPGASDSTQVAGKHGHDRHFKNEIAVDSLSTSINSYISANYSGYTVIHAQVDTICQGIVTQVLVCASEAEPVKLVFDANGTFMMQSQRILYTAVPEAVTAAVTANYSTYTVMKRAEKFTLANSSIQYKVFMSLDKVRKSVTFNADGTVSCEK